MKVGNVLKEGDYVTYPSSQGNLECRVLYDSNSSYGVELITEYSMETVTLGDGWKANSCNNYNNAISILNGRANTYNNSLYSDSARSVGSVPDNPSYEETELYKGMKETDNNYKEDYTQMSKLNMLYVIDADYWLASRLRDNVMNGTSFRILIINTYGRLDSDGVCHWSGSDEDFSGSRSSHGLRPVFKLKKEIKVTGGDGTSGSPYTLGT